MKCDICNKKMLLHWEYIQDHCLCKSCFEKVENVINENKEEREIYAIKRIKRE